MMRPAAYALALLLLAFGAWQIGEGAWIHAKAALAQVLIKRAWTAEQSRDVADAEPARPWPWADTYPVARLAVPALGVDQIVLAGASGRTLAFGPGHMDGTAMPGDPGLSVISGHRDTHFRFLQTLKVGQDIVVTDTAGAMHRYRVTAAHVVHSEKAGLDATGATPRLALVTCYPFDAASPGGPLRYVVFAEADKETLEAVHAPIAIGPHPPI